jgi:acyl-[acyl carrier protein]--UDP-N-acetylglucosamine O-acyltransferase
MFRWAGRFWIWAHGRCARWRGRLFSCMTRGAFHRFGITSIILLPVRLNRPERMEIGEDVFVGANSWLHALEDGDDPVIRIGDGTCLAGDCVISAAREVVIEDHVLIARNVYIADHSHRFTDREKPILQQGVDKIAPVRIGRGAWLGQNVVVCPGVTIGRGAVIGANSVVKENVPDFAIAAGAPARVVGQAGAG